MIVVYQKLTWDWERDDSHRRHLRIHHTCQWIRPQWPPEQQNVRLRLVNLVVLPSSTLLHTDTPPLVLRQNSGLSAFRPRPTLIRKLKKLKHLLRHPLRQYHMSVLVVLICVFVRVLNLVRIVWHEKEQTLSWFSCKIEKENSEKMAVKISTVLNRWWDEPIHDGMQCWLCKFR